MAVYFETMESRTLMSATPLLTPLQKADLKQLEVDLYAIHLKSNVTPAEVQAVCNDFTAIAQVAHKPSAASVTKLKSDAKAAFSDHVITPAERALLASDLCAVAVSAGIPASLAKQTASDVKALGVSSNITRTDVQTIVVDVENLFNAFK